MHKMSISSKKSPADLKKFILPKQTITNESRLSQSKFNSQQGSMDKNSIFQQLYPQSMQTQQFQFPQQQNTLQPMSVEQEAFVSPIEKIVMDDPTQVGLRFDVDMLTLEKIIFYWMLKYFDQQPDFDDLVQRYILHKSNQSYLVQLLNSFNMLQNKNYKLSLIQDKLNELIKIYSNFRNQQKSDFFFQKFLNQRDIIQDFTIKFIVRSSICNYYYSQKNLTQKIFFGFGIFQDPFINWIVELNQINLKKIDQFTQVYLKCICDFYQIDIEIKNSSSIIECSSTGKFLVSIYQDDTSFQSYSKINQVITQQDVGNEQKVIPEEKYIEINQSSLQSQQTQFPCAICQQYQRNIFQYDCDKKDIICIQCISDPSKREVYSRCPACDQEVSEDCKIKFNQFMSSINPQSNQPTIVTQKVNCPLCKSSTEIQVDLLDKQISFFCSNCKKSFCWIHSYTIEEQKCFCFCNDCKKETFYSGAFGEFYKCMQCGKCYCNKCKQYFSFNAVCSCRCNFCYEIKSDQDQCLCQQYN